MATQQPTHSARRIHRSLGGTTAFFRGYTVGELLLFVAVAFATLVGAALVPATLTIPVIGLGCSLGLLLGILHRVKPSHLWLTEWLVARLGWAAKSKAYTNDEDDSHLRHLPRVERVYAHGIERTDGALVGAVKVEPANMALEDDEAWSRAVNSLSEFVNATVDFPVNIYVTGRELDQDDVVRAHQDRLGDPDVRNRPILKRLVEAVIDANTDENGDLDSERTTVREYYLVTAVRDQDVTEIDETDDSVLAYLAGVPILGRPFARFRSTGLTEGERDRLKEDTLERRLARLRRGGSSLYRCSVSAVDVYDIARLTAEYWTGRSESYGDIAGAIGTFPVVSHGLSDGVPSSPHPDDVAGAMADTSADPDAPTTTDRLESPSEIHQSVLTPSTVDWEPTYAVLDDETYVRTFWIEQFPEEPEDGLFELLLLETELTTDVSIRLEPIETRSAEDMMADWISDLEVARHDANSLKAEDLEEDIERGKYMRSLVRTNEASFYRGGVFIRLSADSRGDLDAQTTRLRSIVRDAPANCTLKVANRWQERGLVTASPIGANELGRDRLSTMTNQAVGATFPFSSNYLLMDGGVEYGYHGHNGSPVRIDPWALETGHSELVVGMPGAGKTFGAIMRQLRRVKQDRDTMLVLIDPVGGFAGIAEALDAKTITVGGDTKLNPLELRRSPTEVLEADDGSSPFAAKKAEVYAVLENFLRVRDIELGTKTGVLSYVIDEAYRRAGVVADDVGTHTPANSPTMADVHDILADIADRPDEHDIAASASARERAARYADELAIAFQPFREGGAYENLSCRSEVDVLANDAPVVYIDLGQIEGSASGIDHQAFLMQLLLSTVYQQAKTTDRTVELAIDEAHYLFEDQANLDFLETAFRHQRHAGLRMVLLSQTAKEFYATEQAEQIVSMCPIKVFHKLPDLDDETADAIGLTREQRQYVRTADAGNADLGYSQALVRVEERGTYPLHVVADEYEKRVIEYESDDREFLRKMIDDVPDPLEDFEALLEAEAWTTVLTDQYGIEAETAERIFEDQISMTELLDTIVTTEQLPATDERDTAGDESEHGRPGTEVTFDE